MSSTGFLAAAFLALMPDAVRRGRPRFPRLLALHVQLAAAQTPTAKTMLQRQIDATDRHIDRLVYELYGLTEGEIEIVEGANG